MPDHDVYHCSTDPVGDGLVECSLTRWVRRDIKWRADQEEFAETLAARRFPANARMKVALYEAELSRAAEEAREGRYGCTVQAIPLSDGRVEIEVVERTIQGDKFVTDVLLARQLDATEEGALVEGSELVAELRAWAEERNERRREGQLQADAETSEDADDAAGRAAAARELADILARAGV